MLETVCVVYRVMESLLHLKRIVELLQLWQDDHEPEHNEQHHHQLARIVHRVYVPVANRAERDQYEPVGVKEVELCVD